MTMAAFEEKNRVRYQDGDKVEVTFLGDLNNVTPGVIAGIVSDDLVTIWIVLFDNKLEGYPFSAVAVPHFNIKRLGSNEPFPCEL